MPLPLATPACVVQNFLLITLKVTVSGEYVRTVKVAGPVQVIAWRDYEKVWKSRVRIVDKSTKIRIVC